MAISNIEISIELINNASAKLAEASSSMSKSLDQVSQASDRLAAAQDNINAKQEKAAEYSKKNEGSPKNLAIGASGAATAGLYNSYDRIEKAKIAVHRAKSR